MQICNLITKQNQLGALKGKESQGALVPCEQLPFAIYSTRFSGHLVPMCRACRAQMSVHNIMIYDHNTLAKNVNSRLTCAHPETKGNENRRKNMLALKQHWFVYIVRCVDNSLYTGITTDLVRRLREHNSPCKGAKYTRNRQPVTLAYFEKADSRSSAGKREYRLRKMRAEKKRALIRSADLL
jgi:putative endonuclease